MNKVLVISPHPDDEAIGCGGTILKHVDDGDEVYVIFLTSGEKGGHGNPEDETSATREKEALDAAAILGTTATDFWREPDGKFADIEKNQGRLIANITDINANIIYVPHPEEEHPDHKAAASMVGAVLKKLQDDKINAWGYEVWTPIQKLDHIVDISNFVEQKKSAIIAHKSQCDVMKFDEAILALNRYRGEMHCWPGGDYAEVFKKIIF